ncbi:hypothetical protein [Streptomyces caelestis]|uniref:hypothetical protein n=1 Tax=Streptomyces caelestis TaxID=36816 RepID=UPI00364670A2
MNIKRIFATAVLAGVVTISAAAPAMADDPVLRRLLPGINLLRSGNQNLDSNHKAESGDDQQLVGKKVINAPTT